MNLSKAQKHFLTGVGSIFAIMPSSSYAQFTPSTDAKERMNSYWQDAGKHLQNAIGRYEPAKTPQKTK